MHRESDTHSAREDEELKSEVQGMLKATGPTRAEDFRDPEAPDEDEPTAPPMDESPE